MIPSLLQEIFTRWDFSNRLTSSNLAWAWISCILKTKEQTHVFGLNMVTLPNHISHAL